MKILWLITARSGSKSVPHKNIYPLGGHPLLAFRAASLLSFANKKDVWISTDSENYAAIAQKYGVTVPFIRPPHLATDQAASAEVVEHAMNFAREIQVNYDAIAVIEPTSPFVKAATLTHAAKLLAENPEASGVVATRVAKPGSFHMQEDMKYLSVISQRFNEVGLLRRQDSVREITPSGGFYISRWKNFIAEKTFYSARTLSYLVEETESLEIDDPLDLAWAEFLLERNIVRLNDFGL